MKTSILLLLALFSNNSFADDFYTRYLIESADCENRAKQMQQISTFYHCVAGSIRTIKGDPYYADAKSQEDAKILILRNSKRAAAWEEYENLRITETELNIRLGKIDRNE
jgi:hypothetical protein